MTTEKRQILEELLKDAWVYVQLDPRREGVALPEHLRVEPIIVLQYGYNMPRPIVDLTIDDAGIGATLSFRQQPFATFIPWTAVFGLSDGADRHFLWEADVPEDLEAARAATKDAAAAKPTPAQAPSPAPKPSAPAKKPRPSHLKLVD